MKKILVVCIGSLFLITLSGCSLGDVVDSGWQKLVEHVSNSVIVLLVDLVERLLQRKRLFSLLISFVSSVDPKE